MKRVISLVAFFAAVSCSGCAARHTDQWREDTVALGVFLQDKSTGETTEVGRVAGGEGNRKAASNECKEMAAEEAKKRKIWDWDYYCCTVTPTNECVTKIKALY